MLLGFNFCQDIKLNSWTKLFDIPRITEKNNCVACRGQNCQENAHSQGKNTLVDNICPVVLLTSDGLEPEF